MKKMHVCLYKVLSIKQSQINLGYYYYNKQIQWLTELLYSLNMRPAFVSTLLLLCYLDDHRYKDLRFFCIHAVPRAHLEPCLLAWFLSLLTKHLGHQVPNFKGRCNILQSHQVAILPSNSSKNFLLNVRNNKDNYK